LRLSAVYGIPKKLLGAKAFTIALTSIASVQNLEPLTNSQGIQQISLKQKKYFPDFISTG
jgi:hypothetical protein